MRLFLSILCIAYPKESRAAALREILAGYADRMREDALGSPYILALSSDIIRSGIVMRLELAQLDLLSAFRRFKKTPLLSATIVVTFALGIGINVAVFSILNAVLLRPLPFANASRLVAIGQAPSAAQSTSYFVSQPDLDDMRAESKTLDNAAAYSQGSATLTGSGSPMTLNVATVTTSFFDTMGIRPQLGRFFSPTGALDSTDVIISDSLWRARFDADPSILEKSVTLDGTTHRVVGIAPKDFACPQPFGPGLFTPDIIAALPSNVSPDDRGQRMLMGIGLLKAGVLHEAAKSDLSRVQETLAARYPSFDAGISVAMAPMRDVVLGNTAPALLQLVVFCVSGVFIIMCANIASLLLTQAKAREQELSIRTALGASIGRIASQLLTEAGLLAFVGGSVGVALSLVALHYFAALAAVELPRAGQASVDPVVLAYAIGLVVLSTVLSASAPSLMLAVRQQSLNRNAGRASSGNRNIMSYLVVAELAVSVALVTLSGLELQGFYSLTHAQLGITPDRVIASDFFPLTDRRFPDASSKVQALGRLQSSLAAIPNANGSAVAATYPLGGEQMVAMIQGIGGNNGAPPPPIALDSVSAGYFDVLGIPLLQGRAFNANDDLNSQPVMIVSRAFAQKISSTGNALGAHLQFPLPPDPSGPPAPPVVKSWTIVGIVGDVRSDPLSPPSPEIYVPIGQAPPSTVGAVVRTNSGNEAVSTSIADAFASLDAQAQVPRSRPMMQLIVDSVPAAHLAAWFFTVFALVGLLLAIAGVFALMSFSVAQRRREFGIRMALGLSPGALVRSVSLQLVLLVSIGVGCGLVLIATALRAIENLLSLAAGSEALVFLTVAVIVAAFSLLAGLLPVVRASQIDPAQTLRFE